MNSKNFSQPTCPIARGVACVGDSWSILILRDAAMGIRRFDEFRKGLGIAPTILTRRLAALTDEGLLEKHRYSERPPRDEYVLTDAGRDFLPVLVMIGAWGQKYRGGGRIARYVDAETGRDIRAKVVDAETGAEIGSRAFKVIEPE
ncbi:winged helix-turn-helix transcriptional regulator [Telmatospirillum siberiense]|uniref:Transcriptional regulator n=1 Tax=Telmatospirillum siberiense TaxID=382514 RepID=A0A2N3PUF5_9PROT|nr:helix-turn-helix domain-containing protein [Telmatospirillum siberiense]PKU24026.1 transcriptional regulator [Telmatospirillum siberiense]